jgi:hypothetical protein
MFDVASALLSTSCINPCSTDDTQICGGISSISLYRSTTSSWISNAQPRNSEIFASGQFSIKSRDGRYWKLNDSESNSIKLTGSGLSLIMQLTQAANPILSTEGWYAIRDIISSNYLQQFEGLILDSSSTIPTSSASDFVWEFFKQADGTYTIFNTHGHGFWIGYESDADTVMLVGPEDPRITAWILEFNTSLVDTTASLAKPRMGPYMITSSSGKTWSTNSLQSNAAQLRSDTPIIFHINTDINQYENSQGWAVIADSLSGTFLRRSNVVINNNDNAIPSASSVNASQFAWRFFQQQNGTYLIYNAHEGGRFVGYDDLTDSLQFVAHDDPRMTSWVLKGNIWRLDIPLTFNK